MAAITELHGTAAVRDAVGRHLGTSEWVAIPAEQLAAFATATDGAPVEMLAISLSNLFLPQIVEVQGFAMGINYGTEAVRFGPPLQAGDRVRATATLQDVADVRDGIQTRMTIVVEVDGREPACTIESLSRWLGEVQS